MAKKKTPKKKKVSKTEQKLKDALYYQRRARKPIEKELNKYLELDSRKKYDFRGKKRTKKSIIDLLLNDAKKVNNKITPLEKKLDRFKYKIRRKYKVLDEFERGQGEFFWSGAKVWERKDAEGLIGGLKGHFTHVGGLSIAKERDKVDLLLNSTFARMDSKQILCFHAKKKSKNLEIIVLNNDSNEESE